MYPVEFDLERLFTLNGPGLENKLFVHAKHKLWQSGGGGGITGSTMCVKYIKSGRKAMF